MRALSVYIALIFFFGAASCSSDITDELDVPYVVRYEVRRAK